MIGTKRRNVKTSAWGCKPMDKTKIVGSPFDVKTPTEDDIQQSVMEWASYVKYKGCPLASFLHHSPNGGARHPAEGAKFKRMGVKAGYPDLILDAAIGGYHGLRLELKTEKGKLSKVQKERLQMLADEGYCVTVCYGYKQAITAIQNYVDGTLETDEKYLKNN